MASVPGGGNKQGGTFEFLEGFRTMTAAKKYWDDYYQASPFKSGKEPSPFLVTMLPRMQKGRALDIGMGEGRNAVYCAMKGFAVKGLDISNHAVEHAQQLARDSGVTIEAQQGDLDLYIMGIMEYDSILMTNFKPSLTRYYTEIIRALKQGGTLLIESCTTDEMTELISLEESYRNWYFTANEVLTQIRGLRVLFYHEGIVDGRHLVQCLAKKPMDKDAAKYGLFDMHSKGKDTGQSVHKQLAEAFFKKP